MRALKQVDVFTSVGYLGNPVAVVMDAAGLTTAQMQQFANWTNLSETTFLLPPSAPNADYKVRIFTPGAELPFAGHPTLGSCHAWLEAGGQPKVEDAGVTEIVQECEAGLIQLRQQDGRISFAAPPLIRGGDIDEADIAAACAVLNIDRSEVVDAQWADNGPGWMALLLKSGQAVLDLKPDFSQGKPEGIGVVGPHTLGVAGLGGTGGADLEVRAFFGANGNPVEDPVTGSLNAAIGQWLIPAGHIGASYVAAQGNAIGRAGRVFVDSTGSDLWVGGNCVTCINGEVDL